MLSLLRRRYTMKQFIHEDFLLNSETGRQLYHEAAENLPILDFHNHLNPKEILEDKHFSTITEAWLGGDHYKWRAMRAHGIPEELVTGSGDPHDKFNAWAETVQNAFGNPLYHWTHLELARYFHIYDTLSPSTSDKIWAECNRQLADPDFSARGLLKKQNVRILCTTDDPMDDLAAHRSLKELGIGFGVYPTFRPEKAMAIDKPDFTDYINNAADKYGKSITALSDLLDLLKERLDYFCSCGCRITDHSLEGDFYRPATYEEADAIFKKRMKGTMPSNEEGAQYRAYILTELGKEYCRRDLVMQLHIGAIRNNSTRLFEKLGPDTGLDSLNDFFFAPQIASLLDAMDRTDELPKTVLYYLNPKDADMLAAMAGNFQSNSKGYRGKVQLGSAWWFCDHKYGMEQQLETLAHTGLLSTFIGMLTDSRSFLSFPRHEYFRRILCEYVGRKVDNGEYPKDMDYLKQMISGICYYNAEKFLNF